MKINFHKTLIIIFVFGTCLICANNLFAQETPEDTTIIKVTGVDTTNFDHSVSPSDDFYRYVNGKWLNRNKIPAGRSRWSPIFELNGNNEKIARKLLLQSMNGNYGKESSMKKAGDFYFSAMDTNSIEKLGYDPVKPYLETINNINDKEQYVKVLAKLSKSGLGSLFGIAAEPDDKDNSNVIVELTQGGLGLPERDYYLAKDPQSIDIRNKYSDLIVKLLILTGDDHGTAESKAQKIMDIETHLADISMDNVTMRDLKATYNKMSYDQLLSKYPALKFEIFFEILGINDPEYFRTGLNVETPDFFASLNTYFQTEDLENLKTYLRWKILSKSSQFLSSEFRNAYFDFNSKTLRGIKSKQLRWKDAVNIVESNIGQIVGKAFVKQNFSPESKEKVKQMVGNILLSLKDRISNLEWMNEDTKKKAYEKISTFRVLIGYPDKWKDYSSLEISRNSLFNNIIRSKEFEFKDNVKDRLGKPLDKDYFLFLPQTVNAAYNGPSNSITFPAGIMQVPYYYQGGDDAYNYGSIGASIGHEIMHGFDDQGRNFGPDGNLNNWWTSEDADRYNIISKQLIDRFNGYKVIDSMNINGALTLGENIADFGGLIIALEAYKKTDSYKNGTVVDGFTPLQRFFISFTSAFRNLATDEAKRVMIKTDNHSFEYFRVMGPLSNMDDFYEAFDIKKDSHWYVAPEKRIRMW